MSQNEPLLKEPKEDLPPDGRLKSRSRWLLTCGLLLFIGLYVTMLTLRPTQSINPPPAMMSAIEQEDADTDPWHGAFPDQSSPDYDATVRWQAPNKCPPNMTYLKGGKIGPRTALISVPGSGNTWVRHLIEVASGVYTGSIYNDVVLKKSFPGEGKKDKSVIAVKTHSTLKEFERAVIIVRHPYGSTLAEFKRQKGHGHTGQVKDTLFKGEGWRKFRKKRIEEWISTNLRWLRDTEIPKHIVRYERLKSDLAREMRTLMRFLGWNITDSQLDCVARNSEGNYHRKAANYTVDPWEGYNHTDLYDFMAKIDKWPGPGSFSFVKEKKKKKKKKEVKKTKAH